jgi:succinyl-CoA synthetase beta subunit
MKIHEYQGKEILAKFGVPVPRGIPAYTVQEAVEAAQKLGGPVWVVKAQIHAGGRGKGGGVKVAKSIEDVKKLAGEILGMQLKTHQTGPEGQKVRRLYIEDGADIQKEYYVSAVTDRATQRWPSSPRAKAAWTSRKWPTPRPRRSSPSSSTR